MVEYRRVLATRRHVSIRSFDVNAATRPQVGLGHFQQSRPVVSFLTDDWTCRIKRWCDPRICKSDMAYLSDLLARKQPSPCMNRPYLDLFQPRLSHSDVLLPVVALVVRA
ncbi:hypothetical protein Tco_0605370 [Tanacetum coccineum]